MTTDKLYTHVGLVVGTCSISWWLSHHLLLFLFYSSSFSYSSFSFPSSSFSFFSSSSSSFFFLRKQAMLWYNLFYRTARGLFATQHAHSPLHSLFLTSEMALLSFITCRTWVAILITSGLEDSRENTIPIIPLLRQMLRCSHQWSSRYLYGRDSVICLGHAKPLLLN